MEVKMKYFLKGCGFGLIMFGMYGMGFYEGRHSANLKQVAPQKVEKASVEPKIPTYPIYVGDRQPSDCPSDAIWHNTANPYKTSKGYTAFDCSNGEWKPLIIESKAIYIEDYK